MSFALDLVPGQTFADQFRVVRLLARGGMGAVYVVEQLSTGKQRALKLMLPLEAQSERHFEQEARTSCLIPSEHVVEVIDVGVDPDTGAPWLCMELLEGESLGAHLERMGPLDVAATYEILQQIAHALSTAHDLAVVHRDLKPDNVFLARTRTGLSTFLVKVLDFGLAKVVARQGSRNTVAMGTPLWMAPEQSQAEQPITCATDVWPFGLLAYRMLAGRDFWRALEVQPFLRELLVDPLPSASERCAEQGGPPLPEGFDEWFASCVARDADRRFQHARDAWHALDGVLSPYLAAAGQPTGEARRPSWWTTPEVPSFAAPPGGAGDGFKTLASGESTPARTPPALTRSALPPSDRPRDGAQNGRSRRPVLLGAAIALLLAMGAVGWWLGGSPEPTGAASASAPNPEAFPTPTGQPTGQPSASGAPPSGAPDAATVDDGAVLDDDDAAVDDTAVDNAAVDDDAALEDDAPPGDASGRPKNPDASKPGSKPAPKPTPATEPPRPPANKPEPIPPSPAAPTGLPDLL